jgi:hypothetical protein
MALRVDSCQYVYLCAGAKEHLGGKGCSGLVSTRFRTITAKHAHVSKAWPVFSKQERRPHLDAR